MLRSYLYPVALVPALVAAPAGAQQATSSPTPSAPAQISAPAPTAFTGIRGTLKDAKTGEPLIAATVKLTKGGVGTAETDLEGNFEFALPPGEYDLRFWYDGYQGKDVVGSRVVEQKSTRVNIGLNPIGTLEAEEVVVTALIDERKEETVLADRKSRATVSDAVSAQEMSRTPDSNASDAVKRVVGATVTKENGVALRGLSGRYASTLVNGVALPSTDPDGHQAPIDLLPTSMLANMTVQKSYGADMPGSFAGGALSMETNAFPSKFEVKAKLSTGGDSESMRLGRSGYAGGSADYFGFDDGSRRMPSTIPASGPVTGNARDPFGGTWLLTRSRTTPNLGLGIQVGDTLKVGSDRVGYLASFGFGHNESARQERDINPNLYGTPLHDLTIDKGVQTGAMNALLNVGWGIGNRSDVGILALYTRSGTATAESSVGDVNTQNDERSTHLSFEERSLLFNQLRGFHRLGDDGSTVKWQANYAITTANEPDARDLKYAILPDGRERFISGPGSAEHLFMDLRDDSYGASVEYRRPFERVNLVTGLSAQRSQRVYDSRRFRNVLEDSATPTDLYLPPDQLLSGASLEKNFSLSESTLVHDSYTASTGVYGAFASTDIKLSEPLRAVAGLRYELSQQQIFADSPYTRQIRDPRTNDRTDHALLPSGNLIYALSAAQNLRAGYSYTVIRPQFREFSPVLFSDYVRRRTVSGNPELEVTRIHNGDLRWEWFPTQSEVLAASVFYKQFQNPIELVILDDSGSRSYQNAPEAWSAGAEFEGRVGLERISPSLFGLRLGANVSLIKSEVSLGDQQKVATSAIRPLQGQAPVVVNAMLGYASERLGLDLNLLYNVKGNTLVEVGINSVPDAYERPFHSLDLTASKAIGNNTRLKLAAKNLLNQPVVIEQAGVESLRYLPGISGSLSLEWSY